MMIFLTIKFFNIMKQNSFRTSLFILLCFLLFSGTISQAAEWEMKKGPMMTKWSETIDPNNVLPEYPRPQMVRSDWMNLNGVWDLR